MKGSIGDRIKDLRNSFGMTQGQLGKKIDISSQEICMYETNARQPSGDVLCRLANFFHVSTDQLLGVNEKQVIVADGLTEEEWELYLRLIALATDKNKRLQDL